MNKHKAIMPDGTVETRNSKTKVYSHCVAIKFTEKWIDNRQPSLGKEPTDEYTWGVYGWNSRRDLAEKLYNQLMNWPSNNLKKEVKIIEVEVEF